ncbi:MAG TPA: tetratricopeptide repeat protein [Blastocatellia bacterium]|nr:tetratricopeptide repeat protein [Blastocatellia bacterium]
MQKTIRGAYWRSMRCGIALLTLVLLVIAQASSAGVSWMAQSSDLEEAKRLNAEVERLYQQGRYDEAIPLAERALAIREKAEKVLGPKQADVGSIPEQPSHTLRYEGRLLEGRAAVSARTGHL